MSKKVAAETADQPEVVATTESQVTLHEFCSNLSVSDRRVELIGGFEHSERCAGRMADTPSAYTTRFNNFAVKPA